MFKVLIYVYVYQSLDAFGLFWFSSGLLNQPHSHVYLRPQFLHMDLFSVLHFLVLTADIFAALYPVLSVTLHFASLQNAY